ncbi:T9SS type A sorting domain-containing protein [Marinoscillum sp.]|uniref:T9SS type A sorting domain-containing protein n=1 Tax=Marinoscillum sp. TaxID=2024838 RepID=UPI003872F6AF
MAKVELFGLDGAVKVVSFKDNQLDMRGLKTGIYLMRVVSGDGLVQTIRVSKD